MRAFIFPSTLLLVAALAVSCSEQNAPTETLRGPAFNFINGPDNPGESGVFREQDGFIFLVSNDSDRKQPVTTLVIRHFQSDDHPVFCDGAPFPTSDEQAISNPADAVDAIIVLTQARELPVLIYPPFPGGDPCDFLQNGWLFRGTHSLRFQDNNFSFELGRTDSFGWEGNGVVFDPSGNRYRYTEAQRLVFTPLEDEPFFILRNVKATLNIVRVGRR